MQWLQNSSKGFRIAILLCLIHTAIASIEDDPMQDAEEQEIVPMERSLNNHHLTHNVYRESPFQSMLVSLMEDEKKPPTLASIDHGDLVFEEHPYGEIDELPLIP